MQIFGRAAYKQVNINSAEEQLPEKFRTARSRIMYIEGKSTGLEGEARIGRVFFSKSGKTIYYKDLKFQSLNGSGFKANYFETESGDHFWISGPRKDRNDRLYEGRRDVKIDDDALLDYQELLNT
ncbi:MAG: 1-deoxy-D-xylulose-5-phosphate synthase [Gammaproteobacteria bacterium]